ncbi:MAG: hypothetical protein GXO45_04980 [Aquificae bacterium]|nr:hypothetical protein [Aquificota bacterium]
MDYQKVKKIKIYATKGDTNVSPTELGKLAKGEVNTSFRNFLTALKHINERHYTEAIKWLQLSDCKEAPFIIGLLALKTADTFLFEEYKGEVFSKDCLKKAGLDLVIQDRDRKIVIKEEGALKPLDVIYLLEL